MSVGPVSGSGIPIVLPANQLAFYSVFVQAGWNQFVQLLDSQNNVIFQASGSSGGPLAQIGGGSFTINDQTGNYTIQIGINGGGNAGGQWSQVLYDDLIVANAGTIVCSNFNFIAEDGGGVDYNDCTVSLTWFNGNA
jgi:hypothetical protein